MSKVKNPMALTLGGIHFPHLSGTAIGILGTAAGIGSTFMPWSMSWVSQASTLKRGFLFVLFSALLTFISVRVNTPPLGAKDFARCGL
jgi:sugar phosphate permease